MRFIGKLAVALAMLGLMSCSPGQQAANQPVAVTIGGPPNVAFLAEIANARGFFRDEGIEATIRPIQTGKLTQDAVIAGQLDYGIVLDVNVAALGFRADEVVTLAVLMRKGDDGLVARRDRGINGPADLAGKTIGRLTGTTSHVYLDQLLEQAGVNPSGVTFRTMAPPAMQAALARGDIDAASLWEPFRLNAATALGRNALNIDGGALYNANVLLIRRRPAPAAASAQEVRVVRALARAAAFARANPAEAQAIVAPRLGLPVATTASIWRFYSFGVTAPAVARPDVRAPGCLGRPHPARFRGQKAKLRSGAGQWRLCATGDGLGFVAPRAPLANRLRVPLAVAGLLVPLLLWQVASSVGSLPEAVLPAPGKVIGRAVAIAGDPLFQEAALATLYRWLMGFTLGGAVGFILGLAVGSTRWTRNAFLPAIDFFRSIPVTIAFPAFLLAFGLSDAANIAMAFTATVFLVALNVAVAIGTGPPQRAAFMVLMRAR